MSAPDKIYLQACGSCDLKETCENCEFAKLLEGGEVTWSEDKIFERDVEYIRKDFLLEWAKDELKLSKDVECVSEKSYEEGRQQVALNLIDKLNEI